MQNTLNREQLRKFQRKSLYKIKYHKENYLVSIVKFNKSVSKYWFVCTREREIFLMKDFSLIIIQRYTKNLNICMKQSLAKIVIEKNKQFITLLSLITILMVETSKI